MDWGACGSVKRNTKSAMAVKSKDLHACCWLALTSHAFVWRHKPSRFMSFWGFRLRRDWGRCVVELPEYAADCFGMGDGIIASGNG